MVVAVGSDTPESVDHFWPDGIFHGTKKVPVNPLRSHKTRNKTTSPSSGTLERKRPIFLLYWEIDKFRNTPDPIRGSQLRENEIKWDSDGLPQGRRDCRLGSLPERMQTAIWWGSIVWYIQTEHFKNATSIWKCVDWSPWPNHILQAFHRALLARNLTT